MTKSECLHDNVFERAHTNVSRCDEHQSVLSCWDQEVSTHRADKGKQEPWRKVSMRPEALWQIAELTNIVGISQNFPATSEAFSTSVGEDEDK